MSGESYTAITDISSGLDELFESENGQVQTESAADGLVMSLAKKNAVDIGYIAELSGLEKKEVLAALEGKIYQNPLKWNGEKYKGWETAEEYLSGNLRKKLEQVKMMQNVFPGVFDSNITMLERLAPPYVRAEDIYVCPGSPWLPVKVVEEFIRHILKLRPWQNIDIEHDEETGSWEITNKSSYKSNFAARVTYGTNYINGMEIIEKTLNMRSPAAMDTVFDPSKKSGKKRIINRPQTILALEKQNAVTEEFNKWIWSDEKRKNELERIYNEKYTSFVPRKFDGSYLEFPGMNKDIKLYPYQKNAAARIIFSKNTLLAHDVGSGKTYIMAAAGMKMRQIGLSDKNLYVVPNNIIGQWHSLFLQIYPDADVLCVYPSDFTPAKRDKMIERLCMEEHDAVIMSFSSFKLLPSSKRYKVQTLKDECGKLEDIYNQPGKHTAGIGRKIDKLRKQIAELSLEKDDKNIYFEDLGITRLFVDEAHNFKNLPVETKIDRVLGISRSGSDRCKDMLEKVRCVQRDNNGGGVIFATGTPEITPYL